MNKIRNEQSLSFQGSPGKNFSASFYSIISNKSANIERVPVSPNTLKFKDKPTEQRYLASLYTSSDSNRKASEEFKSNLLHLYIFFSVFILATAVQDLILFHSSDLNTKAYIFKTVILGIIVTLYFSALNVTLRSPRFLKYASTMFTTLALLLIAYIVAIDPRIIAGIVSEPSSFSTCTTSLCVFIVIQIYSRVLFENFTDIVIISVFALGAFSAGLFVESQKKLAEIIPELVFLMFGLVLNCSNCYRHSLVSREYFWKNELKSKVIDEVSEMTEFNDPHNKNFINTEIELLVLLCEKIKKCMKGAYSLLIFKDVKAKLKVAMNELDNLKRRITGDIFRQAVFIENCDILDEQDKTFINQFFMQFSHKSTNNIGKTNTLRDIHDSSPTNVFNKYGIKNFEKILEAIGTDWNLDIWFIYQSTGHNIYILSKFLGEKWGIIEEYSIPEDIFDKFFQTVEKSYHHNPYHNACHAADVLHSFIYFCYYGNILDIITPLETLGCIIASVCHDIAHPALTNRFLIQNRDDLAIQYNDVSVLENMHASTTFSLLNKPGCNILENLNLEDWFKIRKTILNLILDTDLSRHFEILGRFRAKNINLSKSDGESHENKQIIFSMGLKCADLGHSAKTIELHKKWTALICEEFFRQGDLEKLRKQEISMYCDRDTTDVAKSQAGFIKNICLPLFETWTVFLNSDAINLICLEQLKANYNFWNEKNKEKVGECSPK